MQNIKTYKQLILALFAFSVSFLSSCTNKKNSCIKRMQESGYSYSEAKELCTEAERDSYSR